jgi:prefoldin subunit 5
MNHNTITEIEKAREIVSHCDSALCASIARMDSEIADEAAFRQAIEQQCAACLEQEEVGEMKDGETRVSCLEAENAVLREQIAALREEVAALKAAWYSERREWRIR